MQNDLISRSALLKHMEETEISQYIDELNNGNDNYSSTPLYDFVKDMPTAYDVERAKMPTTIHPIPLDTQIYIKELERTNVWIKCDSGKMPREGQYVLVKLSDDIYTESKIQVRKYEPSRDKEYTWKELDFSAWLRFDEVIEWKPL